MGPYRERVPLGNDDLGSPEGESLRTEAPVSYVFFYFFFFTQAARHQDFFFFH